MVTESCRVGYCAARIATGFCVLSLISCGWVDSTGIQGNGASDIQFDNSNAAVEDSVLRWPLDGLSLNGQVENIVVDVVSEGREVSSCAQWFSSLESAESLRAACQPSLSDAQCTLSVETTEQELLLGFPPMRYPVGLRLSLSVFDTGLQSTSREVDICVLTESSPPLALADSYSLTYGRELIAEGVVFAEDCAVLGGTGVLVNDSDDFDYTETTDSGAPCLTAELVTPPRFAGFFSFAADGSFRYVGDGSLGEGGSDAFSYRASDGANSSEVVEVSISVVGSNAAPDAYELSRTIGEDESLVVQLDELGEDPEGFALRLASVSAPSQGTAEIVNDALLYNPPGSFSGVAQVRFVLSDAGGATAEGVLNITVRPVNDAPEITSLSPNPVIINVDNPDVPSSVVVTAIVRDEETPVTLLEVTADIDPSFARTIVSGVDSTGRVSIVLSPLQNGSRELQIRVRDLGFGDLSATSITRSAVVEISGFNTAPIANDDQAETPREQPVDIAVLANDTDAENHDISLLGLLTTPDNGIVVINPDGQTIRYTPATGFTGTDEFSYRIQDERGAQAVGTVRVEVVNRAPLAANDSHRFQSTAQVAPHLRDDADSVSSTVFETSGPESAPDPGRSAGRWVVGVAQRAVATV